MPGYVNTSPWEPMHTLRKEKKVCNAHPTKSLLLPGQGDELSGSDQVGIGQVVELGEA